MFKKILVAVAFATLALAQGAQAQTNLQTFYDFGKNRGHFTTTLEGFYNDNWGNTFFFIDYDFNKRVDGKVVSPSKSYMEIARCLNFWGNTALAPLSLQVEYNGGIDTGAHNFLFGLDYFLHSKDFKNTFNFKLLYKTFSGKGGASSDIPVQFTFVWGLQDLFGVEGLRFSGFADVWGENVKNFMEGGTQARKVVFISEPQLWYNVGKFFGCPNLNLGGEVELSANFAGYDGFKVRPCLGAKWVF